MTASNHTWLAFSGLEPGPERAAALYQAALQWFAQCGREADFITLRGAGHRPTNARFKGPHAKLMKSGFEGLTAFELGVEGPTTHYDVNMAFSLTASCWNLGDRPRSEWLIHHSPQLRIVEQESWDAVRARERQGGRRRQCKEQAALCARRR